jgi:bifunctional DNase/RNase
MNKYHPVEVMGVRVEMPSNQPIVLLKEMDGVRYLPIWLGAVEATAIAFAQQEVIPPRPLTHDLFKDVLGQLGAKLKTVYLTEAIALALRIGSPILASDELLGEAGIEIPDQAEDEVERFKEFLDQINPEDFLG